MWIKCIIDWIQSTRPEETFYFADIVKVAWTQGRFLYGVDILREGIRMDFFVKKKKNYFKKSYLALQCGIQEVYSQKIGKI